MSRVHIGEKNGRIGAWVSPAGIDASAEGVRMLLDSDLDNLKPHHTASVSLRAHQEDYLPAYGLWYHYPPPFTFPDLGFIPLTFLTCTPGNTSGGVAAWPPFAGSTASLTDVPTEKIYSNRVSFEGSFLHPSRDITLYLIVFANRIGGL